MKKLLIYYSTYEIANNATRSVPRLLASLISYLENFFEITFFTFDENYHDEGIKTVPVYLPVTKNDRIFKKYKQVILRKKHFGHSELKRHIIERYLQKENDKYDFILSLRLGELKQIKKFFPDCKLLYWFHDLTIVQCGAEIMNINYADHVVTPSITSYHKILKAIEPNSLTSEWHYIPNWIKNDFSANKTNIDLFRKKYSITAQTKVFVFSGGDLKFKGGHIIQKALYKIAASYNNEIVLFYAGECNDYSETCYEKIRIIKTGNLSPETLASYYAISHIGLFPSLGYEHSPLTLPEMISSGVMPVASNSGGVWEILGKDYAFMVNFPNSVDEWSATIEKAIALTENERTKIVEHLRENVCRNYNEKTNKNKFTSILVST
jgi:glycosyltransferase involved in cell wall biosynthesis